MQEARGKSQVAGHRSLDAGWAIALLVGMLVSLLVCENVPLDVCETQACVQWRDLIRQKLAAGEKPEQIINYFQATYGDRVLQEPPRGGFTVLVWILPFVGLVAGVAILVVVLRRMTAQPAPVQLETAPSDSADEYRERLERELEELE
jgi:cytochrome c-type biogenesis protein CcmH